MASTLGAYCCYILVLGVNGISEAFVQAVAPPAAYNRINFGFVASSVVYIFTAFFLITRFGTCGLVVANIASMITRIISSFAYIRIYFYEVYSTLQERNRHESSQTSVNKDKSSDGVDGGTSSSTPPESVNSNANENENASNIEEFDEHFDPMSALNLNFEMIATVIACLLVCILSSQRYAASEMTLRNSLEHIAVGIPTFGLFCTVSVRSMTKDEWTSVQAFFARRIRRSNLDLKKVNSVRSNSDVANTKDKTE